MQSFAISHRCLTLNESSDAKILPPTHGAASTAGATATPICGEEEVKRKTQPLNKKCIRPNSKGAKPGLGMCGQTKKTKQTKVPKTEKKGTMAFLNIFVS